MIDSKKVVTANVRRMLEHKGGKLPEGQSGVSRLKALGVSHGNAQRALSDEGMRLATLDEIATAFRVKPWQLLVPNLNPASLPVLAGGGSSIEPPTVEHVITASHKDEDAVRQALAGLDENGRDLVLDLIAAVQHRLAPSGERMMRRDEGWSQETAQQPQLQVVKPPTTKDKPTKPGGGKR